MTTPKIFLVLPSSEKVAVEKFCSDTIVPSWRRCICNVETSEPGKVVNSTYWIEEAERIASFFESYEPNSQSVLLVHRQSSFSLDAIRTLWEEHGYDARNVHICHTRAIREKIRKLSVAANAFWQTYAEIQLRDYDGKKTTPAVWMEQFNKLGIGYIGRRLLMQIRAIRFDSEKRPFGAKEHEAIGQNICYCYISDEDPGGSWVGIKDLLTHEHNKEDVDCVTWNSETGEIVLPLRANDELVMCEDGLWSGSETIERLKAINGASLDRHLRLKFAVVSDFGLRTVRHAIRELNMNGRVQVDVHDAELLKFLRADLPPNLMNGKEIAAEEYFRELHGYVEPAAFRDPSDWPEGREKAMDICRSIGEQLVREWYKDERPDQDPDAAAEKYSLGGGGFASTVFFKRSVPKVCLPLLWLDGEVTLGEKSVKWRPLLVDSRRIRNKSLLFE